MLIPKWDYQLDMMIEVEESDIEDINNEYQEEE